MKDISIQRCPLENGHFFKLSQKEHNPVFSIYHYNEFRNLTNLCKAATIDMANEKVKVFVESIEKYPKKYIWRKKWQSYFSWKWIHCMLMRSNSLTPFWPVTSNKAKYGYNFKVIFNRFWYLTLANASILQQVRPSWNKKRYVLSMKNVFIRKEH